MFKVKIKDNFIYSFSIITSQSVMVSYAPLKQILFGSLLGDGSLELQTRSKNARFIFTQGIKNQEYFLSVYENFIFFIEANYYT